MIVLTFGTFDLLNIGHLSFLEKAKGYGNKLIVGVASDDIVNRKTIYSYKNRSLVISSLKIVDEVFLNESIGKINEYIQSYKIDIVVLSESYKDNLNGLNVDSKVVYLPRIQSEYKEVNIRIAKDI